MAISDPAGRGRGVEMPFGHRGKVAIGPLVHPGIRFYLLIALDFSHQCYILALQYPIIYIGAYKMNMMQEAAAKRIKQIGRLAFVRQCKNRGMSFTMCYYIIFGRLPRF